jgi:ParB family transcriptional regulator, chromosome partitioning protein
MTQLNVPLSHLIPSKRDPRRVKPDREAHRRLVALIKSQGLLQPLVVRPCEDKPKHFTVIAGNRRLAALREIHRNNGDPKVPCMLRKVDADTADALSLGENFGREPMHPLDESEAFARLASHDGKGAAAIASEFGVTDRYVRQRMKLSMLAAPIKAAFREDAIDTAMAEAFSAVPEDRQLEVWREVNGHPRHAEHVRNVIAHEWIDAELALFDRSLLPESAISQDLFADRVLIERKSFMEAQANALASEQNAMTEDGWSEVVVGRREDVQDRLLSMDPLPKEFDSATSKKLAKVESDRRKLMKAAEKVDERDEERLERLQTQFEALEEKQREIEASAPLCFSEETKARATVFLMLDPDGRVHREHRVPRRRPSASDADGRDGGGGGSDSIASKPKAPTSEDLSDRQLAVTFTHQALSVREALHRNTKARKRVLAMVLHEKLRSEALAIRHDANGTTLCANGDGFKSAAHDRLQAARAKLDPFVKEHYVDDVQAYERLGQLSEKKLDALIDVLVVELVTAHLQRPTALVVRLAEELKVNVRDDWHPDAEWLGSFQKIQLAHLVTELKGAVHAPAPERKKSDLVEILAKLFAGAAGRELEDHALAQRTNGWLPVNLRKPEADH